MSDSLHTLSWLFCMLLLAIGCWPLTTRLFPHFRDRGAGLAIPVGVVTYCLLCRTIWSFGILNPSFSFQLLIFALLSALCWSIPRRGNPARSLSLIRGSAIASALVFIGSFLIWLSIRAHDPGVTHTEQPMDLMLLQACMDSPGPTLEDPWLSGERMNYYTGGHLALAHLSLLAGSSATRAVNFGQAAWFALISLLVFQIAGNWFARLPQRFSIRSGLLSTAFVMWSSNVAGFFDTISGDRDVWWWWSATRCIQDPTPAGNEVELITEFPFFSFWLGDNHAHVLSLPFLLLALASALHLQRCRSPRLLDGILFGVCAGFSWVSNTWQLPTVLAIFLIACAVHPRILAWRHLRIIALMLVTGILIALPHLIGSNPMFDGIGFTGKGVHSSIVDKLTVFGFMVPAVLCLFAQRWKGAPLAISLLILSAAILIVCDTLMVLDAFGTRMNTVFKAYYQVWILLGVLAGPGILQLLKQRSALPKLIAVGCALFLIPAMFYPVTLSREALTSRKFNLDALEGLYQSDQRKLIELGRERIRPGDLVLEAPGNAYHADTSMLATWTSGQGVLGWVGHEHQWNRGRPELLHSREFALREFYEAGDYNALRDATHRLDPDWVLISPNERAAYSPPEGWSDWMHYLFDRAYVSPNYTLYRRIR